jgi:low temperature requirement protein LtrA
MFEEQPLLVNMANHHNPNHQNSHITEHHFGAHALVKYNIDDSARSRFYGLIKIPRLRQYYVYDPNLKKEVLIREKDVRKVSWTELFYDLIYVVLVDHLVHFLSEHSDKAHIFILLFASIFRVWASTTMYSTRYDTDDFIHKIYYLIQMSAVVCMGINLEDAQEEASRGFTISYIVAKGTLVVMYIYTIFSEKRFHNALFWAIYVAVFLIPWCFALIFPEWGYICWLIGLALEELFILVAVSLRKFAAPLNIEHYIERMGLFVMLLLGLIVVALLGASENHEISGYLGALIPLFLAFALKWTYFDVEGAPKKLHAVRRHSYLGVAWSFLHLPLLIGICFAAAGLLSIEHTIEEHHDEYPKYAAQWMVSSGVGTVMICMGLMGFCSSNFCNYVIHINIRLALRIAIGIACILFGLTYQMESTVQYLATIASVVFGFAIIELVGSVQKETCMMQVQYVNLAPEETKMVNSTFQNIGGNIASFMGTAGEEQV